MPQGSGLDGKAIGQALAANAAQLAGNFPQSELWEILERHDRARYTVRNPLGRTMRKVQAVGPAANRLQVGQLAIVGYYDRDRRRPYIKAAGGFANWAAASPPSLTDWLYALGGSGLGRGIDMAAPDPDATPSIVWTGTSVAAAYPLGVLSLSAGSKILTAQLLRNGGDTLWEKLRLHVVGEDAETLDVDLLTNAATSGYTRMWSDAAGAFVLIQLAPSLEVYRRRVDLFEALTLADISKNTLEFMNAASGSIVTGAYQRDLPSCSGSYLYSTPIVVFGSDYPTNGGYTEGWLCDVAGTSIARAWQVEPNEVLELTQPILLSWVGQMAACNGSALGLVSGREALDVTDSAYNLGVAYGFGSGPVSDPTSVSLACPSISRLLKASLYAVDPSNGAVTGQYDITMTPVSPLTDNGLLQPMEDCLEGTMPVDSGATPPNFIYTWGGRHTHLGASSAFSAVLDVGDNRYINFPTQAFDKPTFLGPDFEIFGGEKIGIQFLPMLAPNNAMPDEVGSNFRTTDIFVGWPGNSGDSSVSAGAISCRDSSAYFAWLKPYPILFPENEEGGSPVYKLNRDLQLEQINAVGPPGYTYGSTIKFMPNVAFCQQRFVTKVAVSSGAITHTWTSDLTQLVTAAWWRATVDIAPPFGWVGTDFVGGDSSNPIPLGDQIYQISAAGRVVFATLDLHALGAKFQPETRLAILDDSDGSLLHTVAINLDDSVLASDVYYPDGDLPDPEEATENFFLDPDTAYTGVDALVLSHDVTTLDLVVIDGVDGMDGVDYDFVAPNKIEITTGPLGANVDVYYHWQPPAPPGALRYYAGERRYGPSSVELRTGSSGGTEWAICFVSQVDRTDESTIQRTVLVETQATLSAAPVVTQHTYFPTSPASVALANGHLLAIEYSGAWTISQI